MYYFFQSIIDKYADTGESFELFQLVSNCTLDIIMQCAFSYHTDCQKDRFVCTIFICTNIAVTFKTTVKNWIQWEQYFKISEGFYVYFGPIFLPSPGVVISLFRSLRHNKGRSPSNGELLDFSFYIDNQKSAHREFKK
jgi:hypothetical protein